MIPSSCLLPLPTSAFTSVASFMPKSQHPALACLLPAKRALWYMVDTPLRLTNHPHPQLCPLGPCMTHADNTPCSSLSCKS